MLACSIQVKNFQLLFLRYYIQRKFLAHSNINKKLRTKKASKYMEDQSEDLRAVFLLKKQQFRVEIRNKKQATSLKQSRAKLDNFIHSTTINNHSKIEFNEILYRLGECDNSNNEDFSNTLRMLQDYLFDELQQDNQKVQEFQSVFTDKRKVIFVLDRIFLCTKEREDSYERITLWGNLLYFSDDFCDLVANEVKYLNDFFDFAEKYKEDKDFIIQGLSGLLNLCNDVQRRNKIASHLVDYIVKCSPAKLHHSCGDDYATIFIEITSLMLDGCNHIECSLVSPLILQLYDLLLNAFNYDTPQSIERDSINAIYNYINNNSDSNIITFIINHLSILQFIIRDISSQCYEISNQQSNSFIIFKEDSITYKMLTILCKVSSIDYCIETVKCLNSFYSSTNIIQAMIIWMNTPNLSTKGLIIIAGLLSNIALSDDETQLLILNEKVASFLQEILFSEIWGEVKKILLQLKNSVGKFLQFQKN